MDEDGKFVRSDQIRRQLRTILNDVEHNGEHYEIRRYKTPTAMLVPHDWYEQARAALAFEEAR